MDPKLEWTLRWVRGAIAAVALLSTSGDDTFTPASVSRDIRRGLHIGAGRDQVERFVTSRGWEASWSPGWGRFPHPDSRIVYHGRAVPRNPSDQEKISFDFFFDPDGGLVQCRVAQLIERRYVGYSVKPYQNVFPEP